MPLFSRTTPRELISGGLAQSRPPARASASWAMRPAIWVCGAALALSACSGENGGGKGKDTAGGKSSQPTAIGVMTLSAQNHVITTQLPGRTKASQSAEIRPQVGGILQKRLFTEGTWVKAGQPLYQIDARSLEATLASAQAALTKAQTVARTAATNAQRNAELVKIDAISRQAADESQAQAAQSAADVAVAQAALETARINVQFTKILSPISGITSLSSVMPGALVSANQVDPLTTVQQLDPMYVDVTQSSSELLALKRGWAEGRFQRINGKDIRVDLVLEDGSTYSQPGRLEFSGATVNTSTGAITLRAVVPNPDGLLMPGMYVRAQLGTGVAAGAVSVPQQALKRDVTGAASVLIVNDDNKVESRPVKVDQAMGTSWLIESGVKDGERIVVDGFLRVKAGDTIKPVPVDLSAKGKAAAASASANTASNTAADTPPAAGAKASDSSAPAAAKAAQ